ncbi:MAG: MerR family transcriptional regulator [Planctomycetota bacterium]|jgi:MerR family transcriptional regulator/heat shock protein HspR
MPDPDPQHGVNDPLISIGVLAQQVGLSVSAVRKYENDGLILAHRTDSGHRLFSYEDIGRVQNIQHLIQDLGLNTEGIRRMQALLPCAGRSRGSTASPRATNAGSAWSTGSAHCAPKTSNACCTTATTPRTRARR